MVVKHRVAVLLHEAERAVRLAELLENQGNIALLTASTDELHQAFNRNPIDLIVIEQQLTGFLTGVEVLERLFGDLLRPTTLLLGDLSQEDARRIEAIGVRQILAPDSAPEQIVALVQQLLRGVEHTEDVIPSAARHIVQRADYIQPLPQLLIKLIAYLRDENLDVSRLVGDISTDPLITADLLRYANSSAVARRQPTTKISDAVNYLGARKAIGVATATGMLRARGALLGDLPPSVHQWHSARSVLTACTAAVFAARMEKVAEESAYILGLMQDLGILVMARAYGDRYVEALQRVRRIAHLDLAHVEQDCFHATHAQVSAALLCKWKLPGSFISLVLHHHDRDDGERAATDQRFLRAMRIGEAVSDLNDNRGPQRYLALRSLTAFYGAQAAAECRACLAAAVAKTVEASEIFNVSTPSPDVLEEMLRDLAEQKELLTLAPEVKQENSPVLAPDNGSAGREDVGGDGPSVLVIDDEPSVARMVDHYLRDWNCRVVACENWATAAPLLAQADIVLCDIHLQDENGIDLVRRLREERFAEPIIIVSGDGYRSTVVDSIQAGVNDYLLKPFLKAQLVEKLRKHLAAKMQPAGKV